MVGYLCIIHNVVARYLATHRYAMDYDSASKTSWIKIGGG